jgi:hypothetical protein
MAIFGRHPLNHAIGGEIVTTKSYGQRINTPIMDHPDRGCELSNGRKCQECPFPKICVKEERGKYYRNRK